MSALAAAVYDVWFATETAKATITRSDNPLPELVSPTPSAAPTANVILPTGPPLDTATPLLPGGADSGGY